jgi:hypothetical protein
LQSTNEELETAKEELQSMNEELATVNEELENRNVALTQSNKREFRISEGYLLGQNWVRVLLAETPKRPL